jgi:anti-sigma B factor antagonist
MIVNCTTNGDVMTIAVEGRIDTTTAPELEAEVKRELGDKSQIVFDFAKVDYISSAGLRVLLGAHKLMGADGMKIININETVGEIFEITGFSYVLNIE